MNSKVIRELKYLKNNIFLVLVINVLCLFIFISPIISQTSNFEIAANYGLIVETGTNTDLGVRIINGNVSDTFQITLTSSRGVFSLPTYSGLSGVTGNNTGSITFSGNAGNINTALTVLRYNIGTGFSGEVVISVLVIDINTSQSNSISVPLQVRETKNIAAPDSISVINNSDINISGISISYSSAAAGSIPVTLAALHGIITIPESGLSYIKGNGTEKVSFIGSLDNINTALSGLKYHSVPQFVGIDTIRITVNDLGDNTPPGWDVFSDTIAVNVLDRTRVITSSKQLLWMPGSDTVLTIQGVYIRNETAGSSIIRVSLSSEHGLISLAAQSRLASISGNNTASVTVTGDIASVNACLSNITYKYNAGYYGPDAISITAENLSASDSASGSIDINQVSAFDFLTVSVPKDLSLSSNASLKIPGVYIVYLSPANDNMQAVISAAYGKLSISGGSGLGYIGGNGTGTLTLAGNLSDINSALKELLYNSVSGYSGSDKITVDIIDLNTLKKVSETFEVNVDSSDDSGSSGAGMTSDSIINIEGNNIFVKTGSSPKSASIKIPLTADDILLAASNAAIENNTRDINIKIEPSPEVGAYILSLPADLFSNPNPMMKVKIVSSICSLIIPSDILYGKGISNGELTISISSGTSSGFPKALINSIAKRPVVKISIIYGGREISLGDNMKSIAVAIPYTASGAEINKADRFAIWCLNDIGSASPIANCIYDRFSGAIRFNTAILGSYAISYDIVTFEDIVNYPWAKEQIEIMASKGIINGISSSKFAPGAKITRAEYVKMLINTLGLNAEVTENYTDVKQDAYYYPMVGISKKLGITTSGQNGKFFPDSYITREDMMVMTAKALKIAMPNVEYGSDTDLSDFKDIGKATLPVRKYAALLVKNGIITGSGGKLNLEQNMSRAEASVVLYRLLQLTDRTIPTF